MKSELWDAFMSFAAKFAKSVDLDAEEYEYKLALAKRLQATRAAYLDGNSEWFEMLRRDISSSNLMNQYFMMRLVDLGRTRPEELRRVVEVLWTGDVDLQRIDEFTEQLRPYNPDQFSVGGIVGFASILLLGRDPLVYPPYRARAVKKFLKLVGWEDRGANGDPARRYELLLEALDEMTTLAPEFGIRLRDRLDAQGLMWSVMNVDPDGSWDNEKSRAFRRWRGDKVLEHEAELGREKVVTASPLVEAAARKIIEAGLLLEPSPFGGNEPTWTAENAAEIVRRVIEKPDLGDRKFLVKLKDQMAGATSGTIRLAAELICLQSLPLSSLTSSTKRSRVDEVLSWLGGEAAIPDVIAEGLAARGAFNGGQGFNQFQWKHLGWLASLVVHLRTSGLDAAALLSEPEDLLAATASVADDVQAIRYAFEYLAMPWFCQPVVSGSDRLKIRNAFAHLIDGESGSSDTAITYDLHKIRQAQQGESTEFIEWYREPYLGEWSPGALAGQRVWLVRQSQSGVNMLDHWLKGGFVSMRAEHLGSPANGSGFDTVLAAVNAGDQHIDYPERRARAQAYHRFLSLMKADDLVLSLREDRLYLGVITGDAEYADDETARLRRTVAWRTDWVSDDDLPAPLPRLFEEQGAVVDLTDGLSVISGWFKEKETDDVEALLAPALLPQPAVVPQLRQATTELAAKLHVERDDVQEIIRLVQTRQQIVFYGPPGTGKTYLAGKIARFLAGEEHGDHVKTVQFHPSYAYEDFFEGYRPAKMEGDGVGFSLEPGPLRRIAAEASLDGNRDKPYFLIIDEMNRGNLAKIFGELYFLLEYRDQGINLQYNPQQTFVLPPNLFIIGTMNTSDRSIAMVDAAIRRRFAFVELHPQDGMISGMLERFLIANGKPSLRAELLNALNSEIEATNRDLMIGPSYFMKPHAESDQGLEEIWKYELLPLLEEQYFGRLKRDQVRERFGLPAMRRKAGALAGPVDLSFAPDSPERAGEETKELEKLLTDSEDTSR
jgi:5-methylcytosine-specific restriction protein B